MSDKLSDFVESLYHSSRCISTGTATVLGKRVPAACVRNLYGQEIVWGEFSTYRGKFKGKLANNANTDDVVYEPDNNYDQAD